MFDGFKSFFVEAGVGYGEGFEGWVAEDVDVELEVPVVVVGDLII